MSPADTRQAVMGALDRVVDPCSVGRGVPAGLGEMGMVLSVAATAAGDDRADVAIELQLTSPACHFQHWFDERVRAEVATVPGVRRIDLSWSTSFDWSDEKMSPTLQARLRAKRAAQRRRRASVLAGSAGGGGADG